MQSLILVYMEKHVHDGFLKAQHNQYRAKQGFGHFDALLWSNRCFSSDHLYQFVQNFDAGKEATLVDGRVLSLDKVILDKIFSLPDGKHDVEHRLNMASIMHQPTGFDAEDASKNGYSWRKCQCPSMTEKFLFQRYTLHMQENREEISAAHVFQAENIHDRAWMSYFPRKLFDVLTFAKASLPIGNLVVASHDDIILTYYYRGWDLEIPQAKDGKDSLKASRWWYPKREEFGTMQESVIVMGAPGEHPTGGMLNPSSSDQSAIAPSAPTQAAGPLAVMMARTKPRTNSEKNQQRAVDVKESSAKNRIAQPAWKNVDIINARLRKDLPRLTQLTVPDISQPISARLSPPTTVAEALRLALPAAFHGNLAEPRSLATLPDPTRDPLPAAQPEADPTFPATAMEVEVDKEGVSQQAPT